MRVCVCVYVYTHTHTLCVYTHTSYACPLQKHAKRALQAVEAEVYRFS